MHKKISQVILVKHVQHSLRMDQKRIRNMSEFLIVFLKH